MCIILPEQKHPTGKPYLPYFYRSISRQSYEVIKPNSLFKILFKKISFRNRNQTYACHTRHFEGSSC